MCRRRSAGVHRPPCWLSLRSAGPSAVATSLTAQEADKSSSACASRVSACQTIGFCPLAAAWLASCADMSVTWSPRLLFCGPFEWTVAANCWPCCIGRDDRTTAMRGPAVTSPWRIRPREEMRGEMTSSTARPDPEASPSWDGSRRRRGLEHGRLVDSEGSPGPAPGRGPTGGPNQERVGGTRKAESETRSKREAEASAISLSRIFRVPLQPSRVAVRVWARTLFKPVCRAAALRLNARWLVVRRPLPPHIRDVSVNPSGHGPELVLPPGHGPG